MPMKMESDPIDFERSYEEDQKELRRFISSGDLVARQATRNLLFPCRALIYQDSSTEIRNKAESARVKVKWAIA